MYSVRENQQNSIFSRLHWIQQLTRIKMQTKVTSQPDLEFQLNKKKMQGHRVEKDRERVKRERERVAPWLFLTLQQEQLSFFPSGGNKVTLACVRTGDRRSRRLWRRPLLTRAGTSRGDRSQELHTGGSWHHRSTCPKRRRVSTSFRRKPEWKSRRGGEVRCEKFPSSPVALLVLFCYSANPRARESEHEKVFPGDSSYYIWL